MLIFQSPTFRREASREEDEEEWACTGGLSQIRPSFAVGLCVSENLFTVRLKRTGFGTVVCVNNVDRLFWSTFWGSWFRDVGHSIVIVMWLKCDGGFMKAYHCLQCKHCAESNPLKKLSLGTFIFKKCAIVEQNTVAAVKMRSVKNNYM